RSWFIVLPSSHCSVPPPWFHRKPSPHLAFLQVLRQASLLLPLPSSHSSPACLKPSPHFGRRQARVQPPVLLFIGPWSHSSPGWTMPSPQLGSLQALVQPSLLMLLPSSQASPGPTKPSP